MLSAKTTVPCTEPSFSRSILIVPTFENGRPDDLGHLCLRANPSVDGALGANAAGDLDLPDDRLEGVPAQLAAIDDRVGAAQSQRDRTQRRDERAKARCAHRLATRPR